MQWKKGLLVAVKSILTLFGLLFMGFGLVSGAGPGWQGLLNNLMNALPGALFFMVALLCWWYPRIGGALFIVLAVLAGFFFHAYEHIAPLIILVFIPFVLGLIVFRSQ